MKQILLDLTGKTQLVDAPVPNCQSGSILVQTTKSLISSGTERMVLEFAKANWLDKARQQPDKVKEVLSKIRTDGFLPTLEAVKNKLGQPLPLGYCNVGIVLETAHDITDIKPGDRVISNGYHAEFVSVKRHLCAKIPDQVNDETASFTVIGAIALQAIRLIKPTLGETIVVIGLGLIGLMTVQLLRAHGCKVIAIDVDDDKLAIAAKLGATVVNSAKCVDTAYLVKTYTANYGADGVIIATSTDSNEVMHQAASMSRKKGRIVLIGTAGLHLSRADFYEKELTFQVSCSYGPGRYDSNYEDKGIDYPLAFIRWTENRNFIAILEMMAENKITINPLISHRFSITESDQAYETLLKPKSLGILLNYPQELVNQNSLAATRTILVHTKDSEKQTYGNRATIGFIGAGNYANKILIPGFKKTSVKLCAVVSNTGLSATTSAKKFQIPKASTCIKTIMDDPAINTVVIATRHDSHADLVQKAFDNGKHVFVEKPLAMTLEELVAIETKYSAAQKKNKPLLMVGFNRRFSPLCKKIQDQLSSLTDPKIFIMTVNAGFIPKDHWVHDSHAGGGRMISEGCHFIDLLRFLAGAPIKEFEVLSLNSTKKDNFSINLTFSDGSAGIIHYLSNGHKSFSKERLEIFCQGKILILDNFRRLKGFGWDNFNHQKLWSQNKGQLSCVSAFINAINNNTASPIDSAELFEVSRISIMISEKLKYQ